MSRFFTAYYDDESGSSSSEQDLLSSSEDDLLISSSENELVDESDDSFFNDSNADEDEDSDLEFDDDSDSKPYGPDWFKKSDFRKGPQQNKFLKTAESDSEDESEDDRKVVKSAKDKLFDDIIDIGKRCKVSNDFISILNDFDNLIKLIVKSKQQNFGIPNIFIQIVVSLDDRCNDDELDLSKENKNVARSFNVLKQRVRKTIRENLNLVESYKKDPEAFDSNPTGTNIDNFSREASAIPMLSKNNNLSALANATVETSFFTNLKIVMDSRGKKNANPNELIATIEQLLTTTDKTYEIIMAYLTLIPIRLENQSNYLPIDQWQLTFNDLNKFMTLLENNINEYQVIETATRNEFIETEPQANENGVKEVLGSIFSFMERLDDEWNKSLLNIDPHSSDYLERLKDEFKLYSLILRVQLYLEQTKASEQSLSRVFVKRLDFIYYKSNKLASLLEKQSWEKVNKEIPTVSTNYLTYNDSENYIMELVEKLSTISKDVNNNDLAIRAQLYHIYFIALNLDFNQAKKLLYESQISNVINKKNSTLQILFNRVVVQLGLSAFQLGLIKECHQVLRELLSAMHLREILGQQTLQRSEDDQQCLPYHKHINLDLIDVVFMTSSLLIEIPSMTAFYSGIKINRMPRTQKSLRRVLEYFDKQSYQSPPESSRDYVVYSAKAIKECNWTKSFEYLSSIKTWQLLPNVENVMIDLKERIKVESLKIYFFTYKRFYNKISMEKLSELFDLTIEKISEILQEVITELEISSVTIDNENNLVVIEKGDEITKLEEVALKLNKEYKVNKERLFDSHNN